MKNINWRECSAKSGGGSANYEVMISVITTHKKADATEEWTWRGMCISFRNKAYDYIKECDYKYLRISEIQPSSTRIYFDFLNDSYNAKKIGRQISRQERVGTSSFPFISKTEFDIVKGYWAGEYELELDNDCQLFYIEVPQAKMVKSGWRR